MKSIKYFFLISLLLFIKGVYGQSATALKLSDAAIALTKQKVVYDPAYFKLKYPMGDVPEGKGVCTDVIIRAYRTLGIDLQELVHVDMKNNFSLYPKNWARKTTDPNIDHRRVYNLMVFFNRKGKKLVTTKDAKNYLPGDIVCWDLGKGKAHIGLVIDKKSADGTKNLIVHNIANGQEISDCLFDWNIIGHYRYKV